MADALSRNRATDYFCIFPQAPSSPTPVSDALQELAMDSSLSWTSPRWKILFESILRRASLETQEPHTPQPSVTIWRLVNSTIYLPFLCLKPLSVFLLSFCYTKVSVPSLSLHICPLCVIFRFQTASSHCSGQSGQGCNTCSGSLLVPSRPTRRPAFQSPQELCSSSRGVYLWSFE